MAQHDYIISNATFPATRTDINNALSAIQTTNSGTSRPTGAVAGQLWLDTTSATTPTLKYYDGADDISLATIDHVSNTVNWLDSTVSITGLSTTATGTVLTLSDSASTSTVNLIIDNQKEIRFRETTANGTNYVALKAPASVSADLTFTLPATDGTNGQALITNGSGVLSFTTLSADGTADWDTSVKTSGFTATANKGYFCNTTSSAFTVTLPATPSAGDEIIILDYAGTFDTNGLTIYPNGNKIEGGTGSLGLSGEREGVRLVYIDATQGWLSYSGINEGTDALQALPYSVDFLVIAGGGGGGGGRQDGYAGGGGGAGGYRNSYSTETSGGGGSSEASLTFIGGTVYTITVGAGGAGGTNANGVAGSNSSISGTGISTITSSGGGLGGGAQGGSGGSGGSGGGTVNDFGASSGTANQGYAGGNGSGGQGEAGGGGGAGAVGANASGGTNGVGGAGVASSITGSSVTRAGGGGSGGYATASNGGSGGGGNGANRNGTAGAGTINTGSGGGGEGGGDASSGNHGVGGSGGKGVVILRMPDGNYSGTTTGSPTVTTGVGGTDTVLIFNDSGSYTG